MSAPMTDLSALSDEQLVAEWHRLNSRDQADSRDLAELERELVRRIEAAPMVEEPQP